MSGWETTLSRSYADPAPTLSLISHTGCMRYLKYAHEACRPLLAEFSLRVYGWVAGLLRLPQTAGRPSLPWRRLLVCSAVVLTLVLEAVMLWMLAELVDLCISLMELWAELAAKHLQITLDRT